MTRQTRVKSIILTLALASLAAFGPANSAAAPSESELSAVPDKALVVLYRDKKLKAAAVNYKTYVNDVPIVLLTNGTWDAVYVEPGTYDLWIELYSPSGLVSRAIELVRWDAGRVYFLKQDAYFIKDGLTWRAQAALVDEQTGRKEVGELDLADRSVVLVEEDRSSSSDFVIITRLPL
jgi:hypothetical protein